MTTIKRLRAGASNKSDLGAVLQTNHIHLAVSAPGEVTNVLAALRVTSGGKASAAVAENEDEDREAEPV